MLVGLHEWATVELCTLGTWVAFHHTWLPFLADFSGFSLMLLAQFTLDRLEGGIRCGPQGLGLQRDNSEQPASAYTQHMQAHIS